MIRVLVILVGLVLVTCAVADYRRAEPAMERVTWRAFEEARPAMEEFDVDEPKPVEEDDE